MPYINKSHRTYLLPHRGDARELDRTTLLEKHVPIQDDDQRVAEIWISCKQLYGRMARAGISREMFVSSKDDMTQLAADGIYHGLERILEECSKLSFSFKSSFPDVPWDEINGLRNRMVHDYPGVDREILWETIINDLGSLLEICEQYCADTNVTPEALVLRFPDSVTQDDAITGVGGCRQ